MKKLEAYIDPVDFDGLKGALLRQGVAGFAVTSLRRYGGAPIRKEIYRGAEIEIDWRDELKLEMTLVEQLVAPVLDAIQETSPKAKVALYDQADTASFGPADLDSPTVARARLRLAS